ncbi:ATP-grasp domain-containing protein [Desulfospira joergensenii]|uniref:ATP-grasp domain-containing protein n=1 Tax=Desulfospira joergensenii TaxID=53329 RepID=UPI0003B3A8B6|nr:ATP-grasp domain-containing protein [Desulfospira joergensenii]
MACDDKYLIVLGAGPDQVPAYVEAKKLGIKTIAVDYNPKSVAFTNADISLIASVKDREETIKALKNLNQEYCGVLTLGVEISPVVAAIAKEFGLNGVSEKTAYLTTNKCARYEMLADTGVLIPKFQIVKDMASIGMDYPFVIKPSDNSASRGVRFIANEKDLKSSFEDARRLSTDGMALIEEYLDGAQISIEGLMVNNKLHCTAYGDRNYDRNPDFYPFFVEDGGDSPSKYDEFKDQAIQAFEKAAQILGIENGPTKGDLILHDNKVYVIEVTSRLSGGGFCTRIVYNQTGVNLVIPTIKQACGLPVEDKDFLPDRKKYVSCRFFFHEPGKIVSIQGLDKIEEMPGIVDFVMQRPIKIGDVLEPVSYANRLFYVIAVADDRKTAIKYSEDAINSVEITVQ